MRAAVLECVRAIGTFSEGDSLRLRPHPRQHQLTLSQLSNIRERPRAIRYRAIQYALRIRVTAVNADLVAIHERSPEPSGDADASDSDEREQQRQTIRNRLRVSAAPCDEDEKQQSDHVHAGVNVPALPRT